MKKKSLKKITRIAMSYHDHSYIVSFWRGKDMRDYVINAKSKRVWTLDHVLTSYKPNISLIVYPLVYWDIRKDKS